MRWEGEGQQLQLHLAVPRMKDRQTKRERERVERGRHCMFCLSSIKLVVWLCFFWQKGSLCQFATY